MAKARSAIDRREAVAKILENRGDALVVTGLGSPSYDVHSLGDDDHNYYLWGAMGSAALVGLGIAQAQPSRRVVVITGDGEQLMGLGGLATIAVARPRNLVVIVIDNERFGETGMQVSHTGHGLNLAAVAEACGFVRTGVATDMAGVAEIAATAGGELEGPHLYVVKVEPENPPRSLPPRDAVHIKNRFRSNFGLRPS